MIKQMQKQTKLTNIVRLRKLSKLCQLNCYQCRGENINLNLHRAKTAAVVTKEIEIFSKIKIN